MQEVCKGAGARVFANEKNLESVVQVELEEGKEKDPHGFRFASAE